MPLKKTKLLPTVRTNYPDDFLKWTNAAMKGYRMDPLKRHYK